MLSETQQRMMLKMFLKHATTNDGFISRLEVKELYSEKKSFFRSMRYLIESGLVERVEVRVNVVYYRLTLSGQILARMLCNLSDNPSEIKSLARVLKI
jgi:hypothetical protein